jgi:predicted enzyme related to lactoylglutathione lyase
MKKKAKRAVKKSSPRKKAKSKSSPPSHVPTPGLNGWITHTELTSANPAATRGWCEKVLGWTFRPSFPTPAGDYHLFAYSDQGGGGIRQISPAEQTGSLPYVHVADARAAYEKALREGAESIAAPERVMEGVTIAIVRAPGGVRIGFSGP